MNDKSQDNPKKAPSEKSGSKGSSNIGEKITEKLGETISNIKADERLEEIYQYSRGHIGETVAYVTLFVGIILTLFQNSYGLGLIGIVFGLHFSREILRIIGNINEHIEEQGTFRAFIIGAALASLFIVAPLFFIGAAVAVALGMLVSGMDKGKDSDKNDVSNN